MTNPALLKKLLASSMPLFAAISWAAAETQTVVYDLAAKPEETRRRVYEQANLVNLAAQREPRAPLKGKVIQALRGSSYLVTADDGTTFLVDLLPGRGAVSPGTAVTCSASYIGIYEYHSVEGTEKKVAHWKEMTEAERAGRKWKTYPEFCQWLKLGNTCVLRKNEPVKCPACKGTGTLPGTPGGSASPCSSCAGRGRDTRTIVYNLVWTAQPRAAPPVAPEAAVAPAEPKSPGASTQ